MLRLKTKSETVPFVRNITTGQLSPPYIHGSGLVDHGTASTSTTLGRLKDA